MRDVIIFGVIGLILVLLTFFAVLQWPYQACVSWGIGLFLGIDLVAIGFSILHRNDE